MYNMIKPTILITDEINCKLVNFSEDIIHYFHKKFEFKVPNARFSPKYQLGIWDGTISFFSKSGETYLNLLEKIIPDLVEIKTKFDVVDSRSKVSIDIEHIDKDYFKHIIHPDTQQPLEIRDYQIDSINTLLDKRGGILLGSTGCGKTTITAVLCEVYNKLNIKSLVIVPNTSLLNQTFKNLHNCELDVGRLGGGYKDPSHMTVISTWQTLQNIKPIMKDFNMVIVDETHVAKGAVIQDLFKTAGNHILYRYGLSGTMPKDDIDLLSIQNVLGNVESTITARTLIDQGYLSDLHIQVHQLEENFECQYASFIENNPRSKLKYNKFKDSYFPDYQSEKSYIRVNPDRLEYIADLLIQRSLIGNVFALVDNIQFGKKLTKIIKSKTDNDKVYFVSGSDDVENRQEIYNSFSDNDHIICVATVHCAGVGTDIARVYQLFLIDLGKSFIRTIQAIGRGLRRAKDKNYIDVVDVCSDLKYSKRHMTQRIRFYKEAEYPYSKEKIKYNIIKD